MPYDVALKDTPAQTIAMVSKHTDLSRIVTDMEAGFGAIVHQIGAAGVAPAGPPFVVYHAVIDEHTDGRVDICIPIDGPVELEGEVERVDVPAQRVASTIHRGPYDEISPAYHTVTGWMAERGHQAAGPPRELYLNDPRSVAPEELLTEVQWPVRSAA